LVQSLSLIAGDTETAADVVGDAFLELERRWDKIGLYEDPASWVRRVALNRFLNHRRSLAHRAQALLRLESRARDEIDAPGPSDLILREALARLPLRQRTAVVLHYFGDLSVAQVAEAMGISEGSVDQHLHRARKALRKELEVDQC
jgi:RNA polymerase sigma-70 factor (ECF subfamily)